MKKALDDGIKQVRARAWVCVRGAGSRSGAPSPVNAWSTPALRSPAPLPFPSPSSPAPLTAHPAPTPPHPTPPPPHPTPLPLPPHPAQVVIIAAGFDTRAYRLARPGVQFYEVDLPHASEKKRELVETLLPAEEVRGPGRGRRAAASLALRLGPRPRLTLAARPRC
jgi:hypothetical protein